MYERARPVAAAAAVGFLLAGFALALAGGTAAWAWRQDPFRQMPNWDRALANQATHAAAIAFAYLLIFALVVLAVFFWLGVAARAQRGKHPTSATLGGLFTSVGLLAVAAAAVWNGLVVPYAALLHGATEDAAFKQALFAQVVAATLAFNFSFWCLVLFGALGLYFLGRALREAGGWLPDVLKLAAALLLLHVPVTLYLARESLLHGRYVRWLSVTNKLLLWGGLAAASYLAARWLRREARTLWATAHLSKN